MLFHVKYPLTAVHVWNSIISCSFVLFRRTDSQLILKLQEKTTNEMNICITNDSIPLTIKYVYENVWDAPFAPAHRTLLIKQFFFLNWFRLRLLVALSRYRCNGIEPMVFDLIIAMFVVRISSERESRECYIFAMKCDYVCPLVPVTGCIKLLIH